MSRIGKLPISIPSGVTLTIEADILKAKGPKGELVQQYEPALVRVTQENQIVTVSPIDESQASRARHGLYRSLIANMFEGVTKGFEKTLEIKGVGYRGSVKGDMVELYLGFSHVVNHAIPQGITVTFAEKSQTVFTISGTDKQLVGQVAAEIRSYKKPEPYKGKGIRYQGEYILRKAGKSVSKK